jgi:citrate lyase beta subunit
VPTESAGPELSAIRSLLFVPADDGRKLRRALASDADGVVADLEDGVALDRKEQARATAVEVISETESTCKRMVRVNSGEARDLEAIASLNLDAIVVPKATPESLARLGPEGPALIALIESAAGVRSAFEVASHPRVAILMIGTLDLAAELRLQRRADGLELLQFRSQVVLDSAAAGLPAPLDGVYPKIDDPQGLESEIALARSLGFGGKGCIHPAHLDPVNRGFSPHPDEIDWARAIVETYERALADGRGVAVYEGEMIDVPVVIRARRIVERSLHLRS